MGCEEFWLFLFADDFNFLAGGSHAVHNMLLALYMLEVLGTPISWRKVAGGFAYEWIGYWQDLQHFRVGISEQRTA
eukprot:7737834-Karenia_brevis.AAC.1